MLAEVTRLPRVVYTVQGQVLRALTAVVITEEAGKVQVMEEAKEVAVVKAVVTAAED